jgi:hypothetical protein
VIGAVAGLALLAAAIFFWRRSAKYKKQALVPQYAEAPEGYPGGYRDQEHAGVPVEKYGKQQAGSPPIELPPAPPSELPSGDYAQYAGQHPQKWGEVEQGKERGRNVGLWHGVPRRRVTHCIFNRGIITYRPW